MLEKQKNEVIASLFQETILPEIVLFISLLRLKVFTENLSHVLLYNIFG
jgi:hypothetical protein